MEIQKEEGYLMTQYSMIQRFMNTEYTRTKLVFKQDDSRLDKYRKTLQYLAKLISKELVDYENHDNVPSLTTDLYNSLPDHMELSTQGKQTSTKPTSQADQLVDLYPNAPTQGNIATLVNFMVQIGSLKVPAINPVLASIPNDTPEAVTLYRGIGYAKNKTLEKYKEPLLIDVTSVPTVISQYTKGYQTAYDQYIDQTNNGVQTSIKSAPSNRGTDMSKWPLVNAEELRTLLVLDFNRTFAANVQGVGYKFRSTNGKNCRGFEMHYWDYVWAVYKFAELISNKESWGSAWQAFEDKWFAERPQVERQPIDVTTECNYFFKTLIRYGTNFSKKRSNLLYGVHPAILGYIEELLMYYYRDEINIQMMNNYENSQKNARAGAFDTKKYITNEKKELMMDNYFLRTRGFSFVEVDNSVLVQDFDIIQKDWVHVMPLLPNIENTPNLPIPKLRFRKLGNYNAVGIYSPQLNALAIEGSSSFIHEYGHMIDFKYQDATRESDTTHNYVQAYYASTLSLTKGFSPILTLYQRLWDAHPGTKRFKGDYYKTPTEVFARAYETYLRNKRLKSHLLGTIENKEKDMYQEVPYLLFNDKVLLAEVMTYFDAFYLNNLGVTPEVLSTMITEANAGIQQLGEITSIQTSEVIEVPHEETTTVVRPPQHLAFNNQLHRKPLETLLLTFDDYSDAGYKPILGYILLGDTLDFRVYATEQDASTQGALIEPWVERLFQRVYDKGVETQEPVPTLANKFIVAFNKRNHQLKPQD